MFDRLVRAVTSPVGSLWCVGMMVLLPFVLLHHHLPIPAFYGEWLAASLGVLAMMAMFRRGFWHPLHVPQIALVFVGLGAIVAVQWMLGMLHSPQYVLLVMSYLLWGGVLTLLGTHLSRVLGWQKIVTLLASMMVIGGLVNACIVGLQLAMRAGLAISFMPTLQGYGAIAQANHFCDYMVLGVASSIYLYAMGRMSRRQMLLVLPLLIAMMAFSGSRSSWLYLGAMTVLAVVLQLIAIRQSVGSPQKRSIVRIGLLLLPIFAVVQLIIYWMPGIVVTLPTERLMVEASNPTSISQRWLIWHESWRMFMSSPWLGVGVGQMRWQSFLLLDTPGAVGAAGLFEHGHNLFLHLLAEMGLAAPLLVFAGVMAWLKGFPWRGLTIESWWVLAVLAVVGIHSQLEYPLWYTYFLGLVAFLLGAGEGRVTTVRMPRLGPMLGSMLFVVSLTMLATMAMANAKLETWLLRAMRGDIPAQEQPQFFAALNWVHDHSVLAPYAELMYATALVADPTRIDAKLWVSHSAMRFMPMRKIAYRHVLLLKLKGDHPEAVRQLNRSLIAFPGKFTKELESMPFKYWQDYLDVLSEARPIRAKK